MSALASAPWLTLAVPALLALGIALFGRYTRSLVPLLASLGPLVVIGVGVASLAAVAGSAPDAEPWRSALAASGGGAWFSAGGAVLSAGWAVDSLAAIMLLVVGVVALMVMVFSAGYMADDAGWVRYYALLSLFTAAMSLLVIGDSLLALFIGWELVGACSYLLIGFWYAKPAAANAAVKAFMTTRVGDAGLLVGLAVLWSGSGSVAYTASIGRAAELPAGVATAAAVLLAVGAIGKSAQFPLHLWLPDAMEGPTPVSALIHAATMVAAGVYLVARTWPLFEAAPAARMVLLIAGTVSALGAAAIAVAQRDIKKVLAYSTISQLGFMFAALGAGAWVAAFFHLVTHAAFKALLFLTAGSVIHGSGTQDLAEMGGLRRSMPVTFVAWLAGVAALIGLPPASGFFSKDLVVERVWASSPIAGVALFLAVVLTGLYCARATVLAFFGAPRPGSHPHEAPLSMTVPLMALALPAIGLGFAAAPFARALAEHPEPLALAASALAVALGLLGVAAGVVLARVPQAELERRGGALWRALAAAFYLDSLVDRLVVVPTVTLCRALWAFLDRLLVDGLAEGSAGVARALGGGISRLQRGDGQRYAAAIAFVAVLLLIASVLVGR